MPSRFDRYRMKDGVTLLSEKYFNPIFQDLDIRVADLEALRVSWEEAVDILTGQGLKRINDALVPSYEALEAAVAQGQSDLGTIIQNASDVALARINDVLTPKEAEIDAKIAEVEAEIASAQDALTALNDVATHADVTASMAGHVAAVDPHAQYLTEGDHSAIRGNPHGATPANIGAEPALGNPSSDDFALTAKASGQRIWAPRYADDHFQKADPWSPALLKTGASTLSVKAGTKVMVAGVLVAAAADTAVVLPALAAGTDYAVYACADKSFRASSSFSAPEGYTTANSRQVGGFHFGLVPTNATPAGGAFNTTVPSGGLGTGSMVWTQADVDQIKGINAFSIWDLKFRPSSPDARGMVRTCSGLWVDIYFLGVDHPTNGTSKYNVAIATLNARPKVPLVAGGDGAAVYPSWSYWAACEIYAAAEKRLLTVPEYTLAAWGVTEETSAAAPPAATARRAGATSRYGVEQAAGDLETIVAWPAALSNSAIQDNKRGFMDHLQGASMGGYAGQTFYCGSRAMLRLASWDQLVDNQAARGCAAHFQQL